MTNSVSIHAKNRIKERMSIKNSDRLFELALERGNNYKNFVGSFGRYLTKLAIKSKANIIVYSNHIFIEKNKTLITILKVPTRYLKYRTK